AVARWGRRLVGHDLDLDAARDRIVEPGRGGAGAGFDLAGPERRHHIRRRAKIGHFDVEAFVAEIALLVRDEDRCVARAAGRPDRYRLRGRRAGWRRRSVQARAYDKPERRLPQARFSPCDRMLAIYEYQDARATSTALRPPEVPRMFFRLWGSRAGIPQGLANATSGGLAPKWLDPRQDRMRVGCALQNRVEAGGLAPRHDAPRA